MKRAEFLQETRKMRFKEVCQQWGHHEGYQLYCGSGGHKLPRCLRRGSLLTCCLLIIRLLTITLARANWQEYEIQSFKRS